MILQIWCDFVFIVVSSDETSVSSGVYDELSHSECEEMG